MPSKGERLISRLTLQVVAQALANIDGSSRCCYNGLQSKRSTAGKETSSGNRVPQRVAEGGKAMDTSRRNPLWSCSRRGLGRPTKRYRRLPLSSLAPERAAEVAHREVRDEHGWHHENRRFSSYRMRSALSLVQVQRRNQCSHLPIFEIIRKK